MQDELEAGGLFPIQDEPAEDKRMLTMNDQRARNGKLSLQQIEKFLAATKEVRFEVSERKDEVPMVPIFPPGHALLPALCPHSHHRSVPICYLLARTGSNSKPSTREGEGGVAFPKYAAGYSLTHNP
jgi:hypothetical protein